MPLGTTNLARAEQRLDDSGTGWQVGWLQIKSQRTLDTWQDAFKLALYGSFAGVDRAQSLANVLNSLFSETTRDADFITPSVVYADPAIWPNGAYSLVWTNPRSTDTCDPPRDHPTTQCLYAGCGLTIQNCRPDVPAYPKRTKSEHQVDLVYLHPNDQLIYGGNVPWDLALFFANQVRQWIHGQDVKGRSVTPLADPVANLRYYTGPTVDRTGTFYAGGELLNLGGSCNGGAEVLHTADLTVAIDYASPDDPLGCWAWVKIIDPATGENIAARVSDQAPSGVVDGVMGGLGWYFRSKDSDFPNGCFSGPMQVGAL